MKLTDNQKKVLSALEFGERQSIAELAEKTGLKPTTVRHAHEWLIRQNIYKPYVLVDVTALGFADYGIFIRHGMSAKDRIKFLNFLKKTSHVPWLVEVEGEFQFCFALIVRSPLELDRFLVSISEILGYSMQEHCIATRLRWDFYPHKTMSDRRGKEERISWGDPPNPIKLDQEERLVLKEVCLYPEASYSILARNLGMPSSTFLYRLNNLIKNRVILGFLGDFNFSELGIRKYRLLVYEKRIEMKFRHNFEEYCRFNLHVTTCHRVLSEWTYEVDVQVSSVSDLARLRLEMLEKFRENLSKIESLEYIKTHKLCPYPGMNQEL